MENTKENIIKVLEKIIECDRKLIKSSRNETTVEVYLQDMSRIQDVIRMMKDQDFFDTYWRMFVEKEAKQ